MRAARARLLLRRLSPSLAAGPSLLQPGRPQRRRFRSAHSPPRWRSRPRWRRGLISTPRTRGREKERARPRPRLPARPRPRPRTRRASPSRSTRPGRRRPGLGSAHATAARYSSAAAGVLTWKKKEAGETRGRTGRPRGCRSGSPRPGRGCFLALLSASRTASFRRSRGAPSSAALEGPEWCWTQTEVAGGGRPAAVATAATADMRADPSAPSCRRASSAGRPSGLPG